MKVVIVILHYKNIDDTVKCLRSVERLEKRGLVIEIIVVNNSLQKLHLGGAMASPSTSSGSACHPVPTYVGTSEVIIIQTPKNLGFAAGVNVGIKEALKDRETKYVLILNNDTILPRNLLQVLLKDRIDIVSPVIKFKSLEGKWVYDYGGRINWWTGRTKHIESSNNPITQSSNKTISNVTMKQCSNETIDYVSGCCMLVRKEVFEKIGLFDERYFFYFEDADFCLRAKKAGLKTEINPQVAVFHKLGGSIGRWSNKAIFYNLLGNFIFISKHLGWKRPMGYLYLLVLTGKIIIDRIQGR